ncbi:hypothetical protein ACP70R_030678 [Stipagrostis hirtigluma subsp. patula]
MADQNPKPIRCKAAVCRAAGEPLTIEDIVVDPPKAYEIRIKIVCTSLCHTDITFWRATVAPVFPRILGHEAYGVVESVGKHVEEFAAGDAVVPTFLGQCGRCSSCASERNNLCTAAPLAAGSGMRRDGTSRFRDARGAPLHDLFAVSSFSQYTVVDATQVAKVGHAVPPKLACVLSCGAGTGVGAAWKVAKVEPGSSVAIFGLGTVGLAVAQGAKMCGASKIIGVDLNPGKEEIGRTFGMTDFVNPSTLDKTSVSEVIGELTGGGADYSFECIGVSSVMTDAFRSTKPVAILSMHPQSCDEAHTLSSQFSSKAPACNELITTRVKQGNGKTIILGVEKDGQPICLPPFELLNGKCVMGSIFGGIKPKTDIPILAEKCMNKELELDGLITHEVGLGDINRAFDLLLQGVSLRCIIWMDK